MFDNADVKVVSISTSSPPPPQTQRDITIGWAPVWIRPVARNCNVFFYSYTRESGALFMWLIIIIITWFSRPWGYCSWISYFTFVYQPTAVGITARHQACRWKFDPFPGHDAQRCISLI